MATASILERRWWYGGPRDFWVKHAGLVKQLIETEKLEAIPNEMAHGPTLAPALAPGISAEAVAPAALPHRPIPFPGGLKLAHIHYAGKAYLLNEQQWKAFSGRVMEGFKERLARAKAVNFEQVMTLSEAVEELG